MKYVVIDLEMNPIQKKHKNIKETCKMETIQIGAVVLDEMFQEIGSFSTLVKPQYNDKIEKRYESMTGITTEMIQNAPAFKEAMEQFFSWCKNLKDEIEILAWSDCDYMQVVKEMELNNLIFSEYNDYLYEWTDLQLEFDEAIGLGRQVSLKDALSYAQIDFIGNRHNALYDARNTSLLIPILRNEETCKKVLVPIINALRPVSKGCTIGDLIDFSKFYS